MPIFPRGDKPDNKLRVANDKVNAIIAKIPDGKNVIWLDFNKKLMTADGVVEKDVMFDFLHLTEKGYGIWFDSMQGVLKDIIGR
jgi:lysophospholipase L1-like esterase